MEISDGMFIEKFDELLKEVHDTAVEKGWWDQDRNEGELIALIHAELSEALEALRDGNPVDDKMPRFNSVELELADVIIRIMDMSAAKGYPISAALIAKMNYNKTRSFRHGNKKF